jgi:hypothetical protein
MKLDRTTRKQGENNMKAIVTACILAMGLMAKQITVFDYNTGKYNYVEVVSDTGTTTTVYDYQDNSYKVITR